ncbi:hypothetical protein Kisp01_28700 [Kineosporia sp. NBRC 101677]|nr:hypothetical protein Kisp01_28700 [Kineosporia sp. NBRC 101677]
MVTVMERAVRDRLTLADKANPFAGTERACPDRPGRRTTHVPAELKFRLRRVRPVYPISPRLILSRFSGCAERMKPIMKRIPAITRRLSRGASPFLWGSTIPPGGLR